jgi:hypothetical protein
MLEDTMELLHRGERSLDIDLDWAGEAKGRSI